MWCKKKRDIFTKIMKVKYTFYYKVTFKYNSELSKHNLANYTS